MQDISAAGRHYHAAVKALGNENLGETLDQLNEAIDADPDHLEALLLRGKLRMHQQKLVAAEGDFMQVIALDAKHAEAVFMRGFARFMRGAYQEALIDFNLAIMLQPDYFSAYYQRGNLHLTLGHAANAKPDYERALELEPESPHVLTNLATVLAEIQDFDTAEAKLNEALELDATYAEALYGRAEIRMLKGDFEGSLEDVNQLLDMGMQEDTLYRIKAQALGGLGKIDEALANFQAAIEAADDPVDHLFERADFYLYFDQPKAALEDYKSVLEARPQDPEAWYGCGQSKVMLLDAEGAESDFKKSLELRPDDEETITALADLLAAMQRPEEATAMRARLDD